jgi:hypothetical protein
MKITGLGRTMLQILSANGSELAALHSLSAWWLAAAQAALG